jgi:NagD protein
MQSRRTIDPSVLKRLRDIRHLALDLDGTLYLGRRLFDFTPRFLQTLDQLKLGRTFFTNNSSRCTREYVEHLSSMGIRASAGDICTSTHATIAYLESEHPSVRRLFVLGTPSLQGEFVEHGFVLAGDREDRTADDEPDAVVIGFDTTLTYPRLCSATWWISRGKPFIATHPDRTCPTDRVTILPDCGAICALLTSATGREPTAILGKPNPRMLAPVIAGNVLQPGELAVVGDRLYTDMAMARAAGSLGILVLSGETKLRDVEQAEFPPDLVVNDVGELSDILAEILS